jgi:hypothetical protein
MVGKSALDMRNTVQPVLRVSQSIFHAGAMSSKE